jgi:uncharacterized membrane protein
VYMSACVCMPVCILATFKQNQSYDVMCIYVCVCPCVCWLHLNRTNHMPCVCLYVCVCVCTCVPVRVSAIFKQNQEYAEYSRELR